MIEKLKDKYIFLMLMELYQNIDIRICYMEVDAVNLVVNL